ncbi:calmodulin regulator protein PCP4-like [Pogoniulus pusillus]|uniref:calmodulin regulator protein PCP4-like n=1 Tax=Pogoniulus pusillus TaxID=488313 RepID=UPI0030B9A1CC
MASQEDTVKANLWSTEPAKAGNDLLQGLPQPTKAAQCPRPNCRIRQAHAQTGACTRLLRGVSEGQGTQATNGRDKTAGENHGQKKGQEEFDTELDAPETEQAAVMTQSQFRKFQKKKAGSQP